MKKLSGRIERLNQRASQIRQVVDSMPAKAAALRETVAATVGHAQQLRSDLVAGVSGLRPKVETEIAATMRALDGASDVLARAGYVLDGVDLEPGIGGIGRRVLARLGCVEEVSLADLRRLLAAHADRAVVKELLSALVQAMESTEGIEFDELEFSEVIVDIAASQPVRIGWRSESADVAPSPPSPPASPVVPPPLPSSESRPPAFSQSSYFARPASAEPVAMPTQAAKEETAESRMPAASRPGVTATTSSASSWQSSALDRFKKMPDLSKR
jgi:hypothetical protein